jgi:hypothetical protein
VQGRAQYLRGRVRQVCAAEASNAALAKLNGKVQWVQSFVVEDKTMCVYLAESEALVQEHAKLSGFPANKVTEIHTVIDPMTAK